MREIPLTQGKVALIDDEDYEELSQYKWTAHHRAKNTWYAVRYVGKRVDGKRVGVHIQMHRVITNCPDGLVVDHINHNGLDNRKENLRTVTAAVNAGNRRPKDANVSEFRIRESMFRFYPQVKYYY